MKRRNILLQILAVSCVLSLLLAGCAKEDPPPTDTGASDSSAPVTEAFQKNNEDMFSAKDYEVGFDESASVRITLKGTTAEASSDSVKIQNGTVTVTEEATYLVSGTLENGMLVVDTANKDAKPRLILNGVSVTSATSAALYVKSANKVFVSLAEGTENLLANGGSFVALDDNNVDGAIFSKTDLTLNGAGSLTVRSPAGHGIVVKDDLMITSGVYTLETAGHCIDVNDSLRMDNATLSIKTGKDGIHAENTEDVNLGYVYLSGGNMKIESTGDGISASSTLQIEGGSYELVTGGGSENASKIHSESQFGPMGGGMKPPGMRATSTATSEETTVSAKGLKAGTGILINNGNMTIDSADDAIHSNKSVTVNGGKFAIETGDDGIHADDSLKLTAGTIRITESYEGLEATDILISGGDIRLISTDDGLNAAGGNDESGMGGHFGNDGFGGGRPGMSGSSSSGSVTISGGSLYVQASGDGIDANGTLTISGGTTTVCGPTQGDTATLDYDVSGVINGGTFIGTGASGMAQTFSDSGQGLISVSVGQQAAGTEITLADEKGNVILTYKPELSFAVVILSTPQMQKGEPYTVTVGTISAEFEAD